jgi:FdhD protein
MTRHDHHDAEPLFGSEATRFVMYDHGAAKPVHGGVIQEAQICLYVNGVELATFMCSPMAPGDLALGFLRSEQIIDSLADVRSWRVAENGECVDVWLNKSFEAPTRRVITAGCGGGVTFDDLAQTRAPLDDTLQVTASQITAWMKQMHQRAELYNAVRGVHTSTLCDPEGEPGSDVLIAQDLGRHNTIDRLWGIAMQRNVDTRGKVLIASGRISSEMLSKAARMGVPVVVSRTSPTSLSVRLGATWNITVIGYCRGEQFRVYTAPERVLPARPVAQVAE